MAVDLDIQERGNACAIKVKGPFKSPDAVREFDKAVENTISSGHINLVLDLSAMPMIDSSGIGAIVNALRRTRQMGGDVKLVDPSPFAQKTFKMVGILSLFQVYATTDDAMSACLAG